jgi:hypothetical protein
MGKTAYMDVRTVRHRVSRLPVGYHPLHLFEEAPCDRMYREGHLYPALGNRGDHHSALRIKLRIAEFKKSIYPTPFRGAGMKGGGGSNSL